MNYRKTYCWSDQSAIQQPIYNDIRYSNNDISLKSYNDKQFNLNVMVRF